MTSSGVQTRAKRQAVEPAHDIENENPFTKSSKTPASAEKRVIIANGLKKQTLESPTRPAKHGSPQTRVAISPNTINSHFRVAKASASVGVYKDEKKASPTDSPQTPRHRDALSKKVLVTPTHRVRVAATPLTPRTPSSPSNAAGSVYSQARQIFARCTEPGALVGRDDERAELSAFISQRMDSEEGGCLYISGPPGTGKSAFVTETCREYGENNDIGFSIVNCMSIRNAKDLASTLAEDLELGEEAALEADFKILQSHFLGKTGDNGRKQLVILDEIDRLVDLDLKLLYSLFEWSMQPSSSLILIGIANALDLTDRFLPKLKSRNMKPDLLPFMPYTAAQISAIITSKLKSLMPATSSETNHIPFLHPAAIHFCAKKVAASTGDLRKAFDICSRAIALIESEARTLALQDSPSKLATPLKENVNLSSPPLTRTPQRQTKITASLTHLTLETAPRATIAHMAKVTSAVFSNGIAQRLGTLNLQQKAVLCALAAEERKRRSLSSSSNTPTKSTLFPSTPSKKDSTAAPTVKQLYESYTALVKRENLLHPLSSLEFRDVVGGLETLSLIAAVDGRNGSFVPVTPSRTPRGRKGGFGAAMVGGVGQDEKRVASSVGVKELGEALKGPGSEILREMLEGDA